MHDVIIVGGGVSGLAAWSRLSSYGMRSLLVEASGELGGRVRSTNSYELGAEFVHGYGLETDRLMTDAGMSITDYSDAESPRRVHLLGDIAIEDTDFDAQIDSVCDISEVEMFEESADVSLLDYVNSRDVSAEVKFFAMDRFARTEGADLRDLSLRSLIAASHRDKRGGTNRRLDGPYSNIVGHLAEGIRPLLNSFVESIARENETLRVSLTDGRVLQARTVVVTVPLSILKKKMIVIDPILWQARSQSLQHLAMGFANKIVLSFSREWWEDIDYIHSQGDVRVWWRGRANTGRLIGFTGGEPALSMVDRRNDDLVLRSLSLLEAHFGSVVRSSLKAADIIDWSANPLQFGSYSYARVDAPDNARAMLAGDYCDGLYFAGEATSTTGRHATVDGAIVSGWRAATQVLQALT